MKSVCTIYVHSNGNDISDGLTPESAVRSVRGAMTKGFSDGCTLLFEGGGVFNDALELRGFKNITVGSYGVGAAVLRPGARVCIAISDCENVDVFGLRLEGLGWKECNGSKGIEVVNSRSVRIENIEAAYFHVAGITLRGCERSEVVGCFAHDNGAVGISTGGNDGVYSRNIRLAYCKVYDNAGDYTAVDNHSGSGIVIGGTHHALVEFCEAAGNGWGQRQINVNGPVGMWCCCGCVDVVFSRCIGRDNRTQPGAVDGDGFDIDGEVEDCVIEYCYSYGNEGAGYLLCEFGGTCTEKNWKNNAIRYCVSFEDATRVDGYGCVNYSAPNDTPFEKMIVEKNFFNASKGLHAVYNRDLPEECTDIVVSDNILITDGVDTVNDRSHKNTVLSGNVEITDEAVRGAVAAAAPRLTDPRDLLKQPVFGYLEEGRCAGVIAEKGADALFAAPAERKTAKGYRMLRLEMYGPDLEGCNYTGDTRLMYDSIRPGMTTRITSAGGQFFSPIPWWTKERKYVVRAKARLQGPDVRACLFWRNAAGDEVRSYFTGTAAEYHEVELEFTGNDKWFDAGQYIGVRNENGAGAVFVEYVDLIELDYDDDYHVALPFSEGINDFCQYGDVFEKDNGIVMNGRGSGIARRMQCGAKTVEVTVDALVDCGGVLAVSDDENKLVKILEKGNTNMTVEFENQTDTLEIMVWNTAGGTLSIFDVDVNEK